GDAAKDIRRMASIIDSMTPEERRNPKIIEVSRRQRIAQGSGSQPKQINELVKQFEMMKPMMTGLAGKDANERANMMEQLKSQMMDPSRQGPKTKKATGKRLSP